MGFYTGRSVLVTGGTGLIGQPLVKQLMNAGATVTVASLDDPKRCPEGATFKSVDLRHFEQCMDVCKDKDMVFQLAGVKGSPAMTAKQPASFFVPTITFNTNMMEAARRCGVQRYLYTSSVGVYAPAAVFHEDDVWQTFPSPHDRFAGWAKRMGELQAQAYGIEYGWDGISIVRPANVYGPYDNFDPNNAMVIPSLIHRALSGENPLVVWGDGTPIRDFIYAGDVATAMLQVVEQGINEPINLGSGTGLTIKTIAEMVARHVPGGPIDIQWDVTKPTGDKKRIMDTTRASGYGIVPQVTIETGIRETIDWYVANKETVSRRYNAFTEFSEASV